MAPIVVYRVENVDRKGMFTGPRAYCIWDLDCHNMPTWRADEHEEADSSRHFGFTEDQFKRWVTKKDLKLVRRSGFKARMLMLPPGTFKLGKNQLQFDREAAIG